MGETDLIDRQAAIEAIDCVNEWKVIGITVVDKDDVIRQINILPTIEERKTGKWIKKDCDLLYCSECDLPSLHQWPYCERCGAKMEE